ncbi:putative tRNA binding domain [Trypanosoma vivax]|uniref:Putative tyrosyl/methionyl-tRNA synthetase n=1 Tax=Trypanosoma vivax (strain Y486) TaxID=1055687 RepID=G0U1C9_TRYVY|nr:putative tyrosyl/methionyl-tRNA synthetase [Trypanosoma vivax]KAH8608941.1 putative tRNA binding domain [Trypanosoma vivax]CCC49884.1 putative tyrosyl/methionyl-tRNA synthetase [Trypanosoma vivax Y486]
MEGPLLGRSISFVERWLAEIAAKASAVATVGGTAAATSAETMKQKSNKQVTKQMAKPADVGSSMSKCQFLVGKVKTARPHPESQKLYIEEIDLGEAAGGERTILSGLQDHVAREDFEGRLVLVIANLEPRKIAGIPSAGMVLCASAVDGDSRKVVLLDIPEGTPVGERVVFDGHDGPFEPVLKKKLAKHFEEVAAELRTNEKGEVVWRGLPFRTSCGVITAKIPNGIVS